jgi:hypothetical protein
MTETDLIREIQMLSNNLARRTSERRRLSESNEPKNWQILLELDPDLRESNVLPSPATAEAVRAAEASVGFRFPQFLCRLWTEVANGGFGPGCGIFGVEGGFEEERELLTIAPFYLALKRKRGLLFGRGEPWPPKLVPICYWGGDNYSAIDCTTPDGVVVDLLDSPSRSWRPKRKDMTFRHWMEVWVNGSEL